MPDHQVNGTFISEKLSKIRWIPEQYPSSSEKCFATGSYDFNQNHIRLWKLSQNEYSENEIEIIPVCTAKQPISGDVTGLEIFNFNNLVVGSTDGSLTLLNINENLAHNNLTEKRRLDRLHKFPSNGDNAPCTGLSVSDQSVATVGEDGALNIVSLNTGEIIKSFMNADSCSLTCVSFINQKEILTGNRMGIMKMFDTRTDDQQIGSFLISCQDDKLSNCVSCIVFHPTQKHIILTGSEEGSINVWDLRQLNFPASYLSAHDTAITELNFHQTEPTKMFTASEGGELFVWTHTGTNNGITSMIDNQLKSNEIDTINPWLSGERTKNKIDGKPLINGIQKSINSFDSNGSKVISCSDNEAIYLIENVN